MPTPYHRRLYRNFAAAALALGATAAVAGATRPAAATPDLSEIKLSYTCGNYFRIRNTNTSEVDLSYTVYRTGEHGTVSLPAKPSAYPYSETYLHTNTRGALQLSYSGGRVAVKQNGGLACPAVASQGFFTNPFTWKSPTRADGIVAIHIVLLPNGKVISWGRAEVSPPEWPQIWDPHADSMATHPQTQYIPPPNQFPDASNWFQTLADFFCSGHNLLPDGRLLVVGGHHAGTGANFGMSFAYTFDYRTNTWTQLPDMTQGRWYPTVVIMPNGEALVNGGQNTTIDSIGDSTVVSDSIPEVLQANNTWRELTNAKNKVGYWSWLMVAPNGKAFQSGDTPGSSFFTTAGTGTYGGFIPRAVNVDRNYGSSIMYDAGKVMDVGGGHTEASAEVINLNVGNPQWTLTAPMVYPRRQMSAAIQADGTILVTGGSAGPEANPPENIVYVAESWNPNTGQWTELATMHKERLYHSNNILLPDARVLVLGGGEPAATGLTDERNGEFFYPPYLYNPDGTPVTASRPIVDAAPPAVTYGQTFPVQTENVIASKVIWISLGSVTHSGSQGSRANILRFTQNGGTVSVTSPANANLAPPGFYLLFVLNANNVPSAGSIIQIQ